MYDPKVHTESVIAEVYESAWKEYDSSFNEAVDKDDLENAHVIWCNAMESFLHRLLYFEETKHKRKTFTRGSLQKINEVPLIQKFDPRVNSLRMHCEKQSRKPWGNAEKLQQGAEDGAKEF